MLKLGCKLRNLANTCLHKCTAAKFHPFTESDEKLLEKSREDADGGPSLVLTRKAVVDETLISKSSNFCKSSVGVDTSQLYPYSKCQHMPKGFYSRYGLDEDLQKFKLTESSTKNFEKMVMCHSQRYKPGCKIESFSTNETRKKISCFNADGFYAHYNTVFEPMSLFQFYCFCQNLDNRKQINTLNAEMEID